MGAVLAVVAIVLAVTLPRSFFVDWGWLAGPAAWALCALAAGAALRLPASWVLLGAALSGLPSLATVLVGVHWAGTPLGLILFGAWCGWLAARGVRGAGPGADRASGPGAHGSADRGADGSAAGVSDRGAARGRTATEAS
jgi:hypothetical protein